VVEDGITIRNGVGKCFTQLLHNPISGWMTSNVEMQNPAAAMLDNEEAIQELELSLAKMPSGLNAFEINDIQEEQTDAGPTGTIRM
jgi:hypothetical protein